MSTGAPGYFAFAAASSSFVSPICVGQPPFQHVIRRPVCSSANEPRLPSGRNTISLSSGIDATTAAAFDDVQQMSAIAFTAAGVLT